MGKVRIAAVQYKSVLGSVRKNVLKIKGFIKKIMMEESDTRLIIFPELALSGYSYFSDMKDIAETIEGDAIREICDIAKEEGVSLILGYPERDIYYKDRIYNSLIYIEKDGTVQGNYRKMNLLHNEKKIFYPGSSCRSIKTEFGKLGLLLGWDVIFSMPSKSYKEEDVDFLIVASAWEKLYSNQWNFNMKNRAEENSCIVIAVNAIGRCGDISFLGRTEFVNAKGNSIKVCDDKEDTYISYVFKVKSMNHSDVDGEDQSEEFSEEAYIDEIIEIPIE